MLSKPLSSERVSEFKALADVRPMTTDRLAHTPIAALTSPPASR